MNPNKTTIKGKTVLPQEEDCHCGKPLRVNDPRRNILKVKRTVKKSQ